MKRQDWLPTQNIAGLLTGKESRAVWYDCQEFASQYHCMDDCCGTVHGGRASMTDRLTLKHKTLLNLVQQFVCLIWIVYGRGKATEQRANMRWLQCLTKLVNKMPDMNSRIVRMAWTTRRTEASCYRLQSIHPSWHPNTVQTVRWHDRELWDRLLKNSEGWTADKHTRWMDRLRQGTVNRSGVR